MLFRTSCALFLCFLTSTGLVNAQSQITLNQLWQVGDDEQGGIYFRDWKLMAAATDSQERIFVVDGGEQILLLDKDGTLLQEIGRKGDGPGEYNELLDVYVGSPDTLFVFDNSNRRITGLEIDDFSVALTFRTKGRGEYVLRRFIGKVARDYLLWHTPYFYPEDVEGLKVEDRRMTHVYRLDSTGEIIGDELIIVPGKRRIKHDRFFSGLWLYVEPFETKALYFLSGKDRLYATFNGGSEINVLDAATGDQLNMLTHDLLAPIPVTKADRDAFLEDKGNSYRNFMRKAGRIPATRPGFQQLIVDDKERIWIKLNPSYADKTASWLILDENGLELDQVKLPADLRLLDIRNGHAYGANKLEDETPILVVYEVIG